MSMIPAAVDFGVQTKQLGSPRPGPVGDRLRRVGGRRRELLPERLAQLALGWNVKQPGVTSAIAGSRDPAHVGTNAEAGNLQLDDATLAEIDRLLG
jgi:aryl-alcohol dehydrogenase-like predicted oxidoreductase